MNQKQQILQGAEELFMKYGVKSVTMDDISRHIGISKKTLYQFVNNKADLIEKIFQRSVEFEKKMMAQIRKEARDAIEEMLKLAEYVVCMLRNMSPSVVYDLRKYYQSTWKKIESLHNMHVYELMKENIEIGIRQGVYRQEINTDIVAKLYVGKTSLLVDADLFPISEYNQAELFTNYFSYHIHGIASPKGLELLKKYTQEAMKTTVGTTGQ